MLKQRYYRPGLWSLAMIALFLLVTAFDARAQEEEQQKKKEETTTAPELSVAGIKLGDRASAKAFLGNYVPTAGEDERPVFYFYNKFADQVMKVTGASFDDPYFITEIEVFWVGRSYQKGHYFLEKIGYFMTENHIFIGYRQSMTAALIGVPNLARGSRIGPKDVVKKKGEPTERVKTDDRETVTYSLNDLELADEKAENKSKRFNYYANYEFNKNKLKKFILKISSGKEQKF